jgi:hypothetical protein
MNGRTSSVLSVEADRGDHEVTFVGALDVARYAVGHFGLDELSVSEVEKPISALRVAVLQQERRVRGKSVRENVSIWRCTILASGEYSTQWVI